MFSQTCEKIESSINRFRYSQPQNTKIGSHVLAHTTETPCSEASNLDFEHSCTIKAQDGVEAAKGTHKTLPI